MKASFRFENDVILWSAGDDDEAGGEKQSAPATNVAAISVDGICTILLIDVLVLETILKNGPSVMDGEW